MVYGSVFFISKDGYLLINYYVVEDVLKVMIMFNDCCELDVIVVGSDEWIDVVLFKVNGMNFLLFCVGNVD